MTSTAIHPEQHPKATCPFSADFYAYPMNVSIAWTYHLPSVHFSPDFGQIHRAWHVSQFGQQSHLAKHV